MVEIQSIQISSVNVANKVQGMEKKEEEGNAGTEHKTAAIRTFNPPSVNIPHPVDNFQVSQATREYGEEYHSRASPQKASPKFNFTWPGIYDTECIFRVRISGVQCRNLEARKFRGTSDPFVEFLWAPDEEFTSTGEKNVPFVTPVIKRELNPTWKGVTFSFEYKSTVGALKNKMLRIAVYSSRTFQSKSLIGHTEIDMYTIATGAVHHDHNLKGCDSGRIVFNCYMEQFSDWTIGIDEIGLAIPAYQDEFDRPEGHDFQEDADLPLQKYAVSYKCTIGMNETFYMTNRLKQAVTGTFNNLSFPAMARLKVLASRKTDESDPVGVKWASDQDTLPDILRYSTFDELMSATIKLEIRSLMTGRGQMTMNQDNGFIHLLQNYAKEHNIDFHPDLVNTTLFGQSWLSLEKLFEDAMQEKMKNGNSFEHMASLRSTFEQSLALKGHQCGFVYGTVVFHKIPNVRQLRSGVISEHGVSASSSVIVGLPKKKNARKGVVLPEEAVRVLDKMNGLFELILMRHKDEKEAKIRKATKILRVLQKSHKASMLSWVYTSAEALDETKAILMRLWEFLLENIRVRDYTLRNIFYELLFYLVKRAELSDLPLLGFDSLSQDTAPSDKDVTFALKLRSMLLETKCCVLQAVSIRGVLNNNFMFFVARMISILCFRLPSFGVELYQLWAQSYTDPVEELAGEFRTNAGADLFAMDGLEAHLDWRRFHKAVYDKFGAEVLKAQEEDAEDKYEVTPGACKSRLSRLNGEANTLNILVVDQWMWYVLDTLAVLNQKIGWSHLPGYAQILKVFFLELKFQQRTGPLSPALYKLSCTMLSNTALINPMTKFLLSHTNVHNVPGVISAIELLGVWVYMIRSWRVRLASYRLSHLEINDRWNFHRDAQYSIPAGDDVSLLPPTFDYRFLCSALRILLNSEHTQVVLTTIEFLYNCWDCFPERHADKLRYEILRVFFKLFLHWNEDVRHFYQTLIAFRVMKPHAWTQDETSFVSTPPQSRRHIDAVAADFNSALGPDEVFKRGRTVSGSNFIDSMRKLSESLSSPKSSPMSSPRSSSSPRNASSSPRNQRVDRRNSDLSDISPKPLQQRTERKSRSVSEDLTRNAPDLQLQMMDPALQLRLHRMLESVYRSTLRYLEERGTAEASRTGHDQLKASWKKKGILLKQGFIYKNTWTQKYFSLQNNRLGYSETENGPIKREINIVGAKIQELPNQIDQTHAARIVLENCFGVDNGYQKLTLCAPTFDELREWMEVLTHCATGTSEADDEAEEIKPSDLSFELEGLTGKYEPAGEVIETLLPYTIQSTNEWLKHRMQAMDADNCIALGQTFTLPVLLSKSSSYADDE